MLTLKRLQYLASRLSRIEECECNKAHAILIDAIAKYESIESSSTAELEMYEAVWGHITRALDYAEYPPEYEMELDAMEGEMAGRVLGIRLARGVLTKPTKNAAPPSLQARFGHLQSLFIVLTFAFGMLGLAVFVSMKLTDNGAHPLACLGAFCAIAFIGAVPALRGLSVKPKP